MAEKAIRAGKRGVSLSFAGRLADILALRTLAIDTALRDAITRGARQLVILGAGYDGRAWRMEELRGVKVFEVDHPATQADKRSRVPGLPTPMGAVSFVPVDFERETIEQPLERAGHDASRMTCWIWEGVVMYLTADALRGTLRDIARRSAPGSTLILNYHDALPRLGSRIMFRLAGEPMVGAHEPAEMKAELHAAGFEVREDSAIADWSARWAGGGARFKGREYVRVVVAVMPSGVS
jgi:methyltransferase (TIGR00027 family)